MANLRTSTKCCKPKACQICAKGALLNLIDETVCSSRIIRLSSRPISPSPYRESEKRDDSSQILPTVVSHSRCTFHGTLAERQRKGKAIAGCNKCPAISKRREGHAEETIDFPRISISKTGPRSFRRKRSKRLAVKFNPLLTVSRSICRGIERGTNDIESCN